MNSQEALAWAEDRERRVLSVPARTGAAAAKELHLQLDTALFAGCHLRRDRAVFAITTIVNDAQAPAILLVRPMTTQTLGDGRRLGLSSDIGMSKDSAMLASARWTCIPAG